MNSYFRYFEDIPISSEQLEIVKTILSGPMTEALELLEDESIDYGGPEEGLEP